MGQGVTPEVGYAPVNGLQLYYEIHGEAPGSKLPLVLLHGGGDTIGTSFGRILPVLARTRRVIAFEQQGCGHTADVADRPFTFEQSADDTIAALAHLGIERADCFGFSNGGTIAMQIAMRKPSLPRKLVLASAFFARRGAVAGFWDGMMQARIEHMPGSLKQAYLAVAPHPEHFETFFWKAARRMQQFEDIPDQAIAGIRSPALVVVGDADVMTPEHAVETYRLIPHSRVAILPGTDHMALTSRVDWLAPMIDEFLDAPMP